MKKFLLIVGAVVIVLALMMALPRAYERFLPVNNLAALALGSEKPEDVGKLVVK